MIHMFNGCLRGSRTLFLWCYVTFCVKTTQLLPLATNSLSSEEVRNEDQTGETDIKIVKENILSQLGLDREPDLSEVNVSQIEMDRVLEIYRRNTRNLGATQERNKTVRRFYTYRDEVPLQHQFRNDLFRRGRRQILFFRLDFPNHKRNSTRGLTVNSATLSIYMVRRGVHHQVDGRGGRTDAVSVSEQPKQATVYIYQLQEPIHVKNLQNPHELQESLRVENLHGLREPVHVENPHRLREPVHVENSKRFYEPIQVKISQYRHDPAYVENPHVHLHNPNRLLVSAQRVLLSSDRWEIFDVSKAVESWVEFPAINYGLLIECNECETHDYVFLSVNSSDILATNSINNETIVEKMSYQTPGRASLDIELTESYVRSKRSKHKKKKKTHYPLDCTNGNITTLCCRYSMTISFEELKWHWIIRPKQFEAYFCKGRCDPNYKNYVSRHARIQNLIRRIKDRRKEIPRSCCTPKKMKPLQVVYLKNKSEVDTKKLRGMIVSQCGCA